MTADAWAPPSNGTSESLVGLSEIRAAVRGSRRRLLALAVVGLFVGLSIHAIVPRRYTALTDVYLVEPANVPNQIDAVAADIALLDTRAVADAAAASLRSAAAGSIFHGIVAPTTATAVVPIEVHGPSPTVAARWDAAVARSFLDVRNKVLERTAESQSTALRPQISQINRDLEAVTASITAAGANPSAGLSALLSRQASDSSQLAQIESQVQQLQTDASAAAAASVVLAPPLVDSTSRKKLLAEDGAGGLAAGLGLGLLVVAVSALTSRSARRRCDVAAALRAPVMLSIGGASSASRLGRGARRRIRRPDAPLLQLSSFLGAELDRGGTATLTAVPVGAEEVTAMGMLVLAERLGREGHRTTVVDLSAGSRLVHLSSGRPDTVSALEAGSLDPVVWSPDNETEEMPPAVAGAGVTLIFSPPRPGGPPGVVRHVAGPAVAVVRAGSATPERLRAIASWSSEVGLRIRSAVLLDADPTDDSYGGPEPSAVVPHMNGTARRPSGSTHSEL